MEGRMRRTAKKKVLLTLIIALVIGTIPSAVYATSTQKKIDEAERNKSELEGKLDETNQDLEKLNEEHGSLQGSLNKLNKQLTQVSENLADLEQKIKDKEQNILDTQAALEEAKETESWQYECMKRRLKFRYEYSDADLLDRLLTSGNFSDLLSMTDNFEKIAEYDQKQMEKYQANRAFIEEEEERLIQEKEDLESLKVMAEAEKNKVTGLISQTANSVAQYADQISDAEAAALAYEEELKKEEENLEYLRKRLEEEIAMSRQAANASWRDISEITFQEGDRHLLANLIYCEAGGEAYAGQLAVAAVVVNRVLSSVYPDTVVGVIYQSGQFSPVASGRLELALASNRATESCYKAADEAMAGINNIGNCVFFRTPVEGLTGISIGGHIFY